MTALLTALAIQFPNIDPVLVHLGPISIRWYALSYIAGLVLGWLYMRTTVGKTALWSAPDSGIPITTKTHIDDFLVWATLGVLIGGRLGHIVFYALILEPQYILENPLRVFYVWEGGMSFHGGLIGVIAAILWFCRKHKIDILRFGDAIAIAAPIGLGFGRIANFINAEIVGKVSSAPWAVIFCNDRIRATHGGTCPAGELPRHPAQLYEAALEGLALFVILYALAHWFKGLRRPGLATGVFLLAYAAFRIFVEVLFRDSNNKLGTSGWTLGELLSIPMALVAVPFLWTAFADRFGPVPGGARIGRFLSGAPAQAAPEKK
ncbi:MAG: prolipoprotein diacylglyceryl transferase [Alphaproteobacteria bacterium]